jgi:hypothetical protein
MKLSEAKSIGKKIILLVFCVGLLLIFASLSFGEMDPRYKDLVRGHPWDEMDLCAGQDSTVVTYDKAITNYTTSVWMIRILGVDLILTKKMNSISPPKTSLHKPSVFKEK